jgi:hypothetical protein
MLWVEGSEGAMTVFRSYVFPNGLDQAPITSAVEFEDSADWRTHPVPLVRVDKDACFGKLSESFPTAGEVVDSWVLFCDIRSFVCGSRTHELSKIVEHKRKTGWYISAPAPFRKGACYGQPPSLIGEWRPHWCGRHNCIGSRCSSLLFACRPLALHYP